MAPAPYSLLRKGATGLRMPTALPKARVRTSIKDTQPRRQSATAVQDELRHLVMGLAQRMKAIEHHPHPATARAHFGISTSSPLLGAAAKLGAGTAFEKARVLLGGRIGEGKRVIDGDRFRDRRGTLLERRRTRWLDHGWCWRQHQDGRAMGGRSLGTQSQNSRRTPGNHLFSPREWCEERLGDTPGGSVVVDAPRLRRSVASLRTFPFPHKVHSHGRGSTRRGAERQPQNHPPVQVPIIKYSGMSLMNFDK